MIRPLNDARAEYSPHFSVDQAFTMQFSRRVLAGQFVWREPGRAGVFSISESDGSARSRLSVLLLSREALRSHVHVQQANGEGQDLADAYDRSRVAGIVLEVSVDAPQTGFDFAMRAKVFWVNGPWLGRLGILPRPRGGDWLSDEAKAWREAGVDVVVSLLEPEEAGHPGSRKSHCLRRSKPSR
jgi:hypothetical protein